MTEIDSTLDCPQCEKGRLVYAIQGDTFTCNLCGHVATPEELGEFDDSEDDETSDDA